MYFKRTDWEAHPVEPGIKLDPHRVEGIAIHWPGMETPATDVDQVKQLLRAWQAQHMDGEGWRDIAYQAAVDQAGNVYRLRGLGYQSAANGNEDVNKRFGAILCVLAIGEQPSGALVLSTKKLIRRQRTMFPRSRRVVPHSEIRPEPTDCPGDKLRTLIAKGVLT